MIKVANLPKSINEEILFEHFRKYGKILEIKMNTDYHNSISAIIEYADSISAKSALSDQSGAKIMNEPILLTLYDESENEQWKTVHLFVTNISADIKEHQLRQFFEQFGNVVSCKIKKIQQCKQSNSGFVEFFQYEDTQYLMEIYSKQTLKINGNVLIIQPYKEKFQPKPQSQITVSFFCRKLTLAEKNIPDVQRFIEFAWEILITEYFTIRNIKLRGCFVKVKNLSETPSVLIIFDTLNDTIKFMRQSEQSKNHQCFNQSTDILKDLFSRSYNYINIQSTLQQFIQLSHLQNDYFLGAFSHFTCHYHYNTAESFDDRILVIENLKQETTSQQIQDFFQQFGIIKIAIIKETSADNLGSKLKVCYALALTSSDANNIISEFHITIPSLEAVNKICNGNFINISKLHYSNKDYEKIQTELYQFYISAKTTQSKTPVPLINESMRKEQFTQFEQIIEQFEQFQFLSQLDQKYVIQQLVFLEVSQHSFLNLVNQKRIACIITAKFNNIQEILQLQQKREEFELEIEEAENLVIIDLHRESLKQYSSYQDIMERFSEFYCFKDDLKINIIKLLICDLIMNKNHVPKNLASKLAKRIIKQFNSNIQDLLCLLEDKQELLNALNSLDQQISQIKQ